MSYECPKSAIVGVKRWECHGLRPQDRTGLQRYQRIFPSLRSYIEGKAAVLEVGIHDSGVIIHKAQWTYVRQASQDRSERSRVVFLRGARIVLSRRTL